MMKGEWLSKLWYIDMIKYHSSLNITNNKKGKAYIIMLIFKNMMQMYRVQHNNDRLYLWSTYSVSGILFTLGTIIILILQIRKLRHRVVKKPIQDHTTIK